MGSVKTLNELDFPIYFSCWVQPFIAALHNWNEDCTPLSLLVYETNYRVYQKSPEENKIHTIRNVLGLPVHLSASIDELLLWLEAGEMSLTGVLVEASIPFDDWPHEEIHPKVTTVLHYDRNRESYLLLDENGPQSAAKKIRHYMLTEVPRSHFMASLQKVQETGRFFYYHFENQGGSFSVSKAKEETVRHYLNFAEFILSHPQSILQGFRKFADQIVEENVDLLPIFEEFMGFTLAPWVHAMDLNARVLLKHEPAVRDFKLLRERMYALHLLLIKDTVKNGSVTQVRTLNMVELIRDCVRAAESWYQMLAGMGEEPIRKAVSRRLEVSHQLSWDERPFFELRSDCPL